MSVYVLFETSEYELILIISIPIFTSGPPPSSPSPHHYSAKHSAKQKLNGLPHTVHGYIHVDVHTPYTRRNGLPRFIKRQSKQETFELGFEVRVARFRT